MSDYIYEKNARTLIANAFKIISIIELIIIVIFGIYAYLLTGKLDEIKPLPIFINRESGEAKPVDFSFVDAAGETRCNAEIDDFVTGFLTDLYTFNRLTVKSNLVNALSRASKEGTVDIKNALMLSRRYDVLNRNLQGLVKIKNISIIQKLPDLKVQVYFKKKLVSMSGRTELDRECISIMRIKPIVRKRTNSHGLLIIEYRENYIISEEGNPDEKQGL